MSLSEDERKELEWFRAYHTKHEARKESKSILDWAYSRGIIFGLASSWIIPFFTPDTPFGRGIQIVGVLGCFFGAVLSTYYGPFKTKRKVMPND